MSDRAIGRPEPLADFRRFTIHDSRIAEASSTVDLPEPFMPTKTFSFGSSLRVSLLAPRNCFRRMISMCMIVVFLALSLLDVGGYLRVLMACLSKYYELEREKRSDR